MRRVLVVANQTLTDDKLLDVVQSLVAHEPCHVEVVVPVTPLTDQEASLRHSEHLGKPVRESGAVTVALHRLELGLARFAEVGITAEGDTGDPNPMKAVAACMALNPADVIVVATLPSRRSRWVAKNVPQKLHRKYGVPVLHVETEAVADRSRRHVRTTAPIRHASHR
jgi:GABA permease